MKQLNQNNLRETVKACAKTKIMTEKNQLVSSVVTTLSRSSKKLNCAFEHEPVDFSWLGLMKKSL